MGLGISLVTFAELGTTAITVPAYVLSLLFPISFGMLTMLFNILYIFIQMILMGKDFPKAQYMQLLVGVVLGLSIDFWYFLISFISKPYYFVQLLMVLIGCAVIAISIVLQLKVQVVHNPAEGIVKVISMKTKKKFSRVKVLFDIGLVLLAAIISFAGFGTIYGIGEGTVISAFLIGPLVKLFQKLSDYQGNTASLTMSQGMNVLCKKVYLLWMNVYLKMYMLP